MERFAKKDVGGKAGAGKRRRHKWPETSITKLLSITRTQLKPIDPLLSIMGRAIMPKAKSTPMPQSSIPKRPINTATKPTLRANSKNNDKSVV